MLLFHFLKLHSLSRNPLQVFLTRAGLATNTSMKYLMTHSFLFRRSLALTAAAALGLTACATSSTSTPTASSPPSTLLVAALPLVRTGAAVATGAVLDFTVQQSATRTRLANEMYSAASAVYSLSGGTFPTPTQLQGTIAAFGGSETDAAYAQFATAIASLYAAWYPKLATGDAQAASALLNAVAGGIEDATQSYVNTPATNGGAS